VWVAEAYDRTVSRVDPATRRRRPVSLDDRPTQIACGGGSVWVSSQAAGTVTEVGAAGNVVDTISTGRGASGMAFGRGALWVANTGDGTVSRIDPRRGVQTALIPVGARDGPSNVAVGAGGVWVSNELAGTLARIDPARARVVHTVIVGNRPQGLAVTDGALWAGVQGSGVRHRGGTLRILVNARTIPGPAKSGKPDPATAYYGLTAQILGLTNDGLLTFQRVGGRQGTTVVPDLAVGSPTPTDGGHTYTFQLRRGIRYSTGAPVRASDFRHELERFFRAGYAPSSFYSGIVGGAACARRPARCATCRRASGPTTGRARSPSAWWRPIRTSRRSSR
jgi:DNA-binding beta-propeller fold protein YncE